MSNEQTQTAETSQLLQKPPVSKSPLAQMFMSNGKLDSFKDISHMHMEIRIPLPIATDPFRICTNVKEIFEDRLETLGYKNVQGTKWLLGSYEIPGAWVEILLEKKENVCYYAFL